MMAISNANSLQIHKIAGHPKSIYKGGLFSNSWDLAAVQPGALSIHMVPFEDRARWLFLEEKATRASGASVNTRIENAIERQKKDGNAFWDVGFLFRHLGEAVRLFFVATDPADCVGALGIKPDGAVLQSMGTMAFACHACN